MYCPCMRVLLLALLLSFLLFRVVLTSVYRQMSSSFYPFPLFCACFFLFLFFPHGIRNKRLPAIGKFMKAAIEEAYQKEDRLCNVKYIDPSYMIRCAASTPFMYFEEYI